MLTGVFHRNGAKDIIIRRALIPDGLRQAISVTAIVLAGLLSAIGTGGGGGGGGVSPQPVTSPEPTCVEHRHLIFADVEGADLEREYISNEVVVGTLCEDSLLGIATASGAEHSIDGGPWRREDSDILSGQRVRIRMLSAPTYDTRKTAQVTIGQILCDDLLIGEVCFLRGTLSEYSITTRSGDAAEAPLASITSHVDGEVVNASVLTVTGTATDPDGIAEVHVNDVAATSDDNFVTWQVRVPLQTGLNELVVSTADVFLNRNLSAYSITVENRRMVFNAAEAVFMRAGSNRLFVADSQLNALVVINTQTDDWMNLSDAQDANGLAIAEVRRLVVNAAETHAWMLGKYDNERGYSDLIEIDLATGARTLLTDSAAPIDEMADLALDEVNQQLLLLLVEPGPTTSSTLVSGRILTFDLTSGDTQLISDNTMPTEEPTFWGTLSILFDTAGQQLLVFQAHKIMTVQPVTGERQLLIEDNHIWARVSVIDEIGGRAIFGNRGSSQATSFSRLDAVDLSTGNQSLVVGAQRSLSNSIDVAYDWLNDRLFYASGGHIGTIDLVSGAVNTDYY